METIKLNPDAKPIDLHYSFDLTDLIKLKDEIETLLAHAADTLNKDMDLIQLKQIIFLNRILSDHIFEILNVKSLD